MANFNLQDYVDVQTRITRFWEDHPDGSIRTVLASDPSDFKTCRYRAEVYKDQSNETPDATGYAFEIAGSGMANKTSHEENCETSAIGRALANLGYATSGSNRPSRQEMSKAVSAPQAAQQPRSAPKEPKQGNTPAPANIDRERANKRLHAVGNQHGIDHNGIRALVLAKAMKEGLHISSTSEAPGAVLAATADAIEAKPQALKQWADKQLSEQAELMPGEDDVPNPDRWTN